MNDWVVGIDLGGTKVELGLINPENIIVDRYKMPTNPDDGPESVVARIADCVNQFQTRLSQDDHIVSVGICTPGPVDHENGVLINPTNLPKFYNIPLRQMKLF